MDRLPGPEKVAVIGSWAVHVIVEVNWISCVKNMERGTQQS